LLDQGTIVDGAEASESLRRAEAEQAGVFMDRAGESRK
jgi:hypothetical protein